MLEGEPSDAWVGRFIRKFNLTSRKPNVLDGVRFECVTEKELKNYMSLFKVNIL